MKDFAQLTASGQARRLRRVVSAALAEYDLDVTQVRLITNLFNAIFRIDTADGGRYVMRVCRADKGPEHITQLRSEMMWLAALREDADLAVPEPLRTRDGSLVTTVSVEGIPEPRHCMIFSWLAGGDISERLTLANLERFGALSAHLHQHAAGWTPPSDFSVPRYDTPFPLDEPVVILNDEHRQHLPAKRRALFEDILARQQALIDRWQADGEPMRVIHGDLHRWNVKAYRGQVAAFDFEEIVWGWPVQDIGITFYYFHGERNYADLRAAFQRGYVQVAPWPERTPGEIDLFIAGRGIDLCNALLQEINPEWRAEAPAYIKHTEQRIRALLAGEEFTVAYW